MNSFLFAILDNKIIKSKCINNECESWKGNTGYLCVLGKGSFRLDPDCNIKNILYPCHELGTYFEQSSLTYKYIAEPQFY